MRITKIARHIPPILLLAAIAVAGPTPIAQAHTGKIDTLFGGGNPNEIPPENETKSVRDCSGRLVRMYGEFPKNEVLRLPSSVAVDQAGETYVADAGEGVIYRVTRGKTTTWSTVNPPNVEFTRNGLRWKPGFGGENRSAAEAIFNKPTALVFRTDGTLLFADMGNHRLRGIRPVRPRAALDYHSKVIPFAGTGELGSKIGAIAEKSELSIPHALAVGTRGVYVIDQGGGRLSVIQKDGTMKVLVGGGVASFPFGGWFAFHRESVRFGFNGEDLDAAVITVNQMGGVAELPDGDVIFTDAHNDRVRLIDAKTNRVRTVAGTGEPGFNGLSGVATKLELNNPTGIVVHPNGYEVLISERDNHLVRRLNLKSGLMTTIAGTGDPGFNGDNIPAEKAQLNSPLGMAITAKGELLIADSNNKRIRIIDAGLLPGHSAEQEAQRAEDALIAQLDAERRKAEQAEKERARRAREKVNGKLKQTAAGQVTEKELPGKEELSREERAAELAASIAAVTKKRQSPKQEAVTVSEPWETVGQKHAPEQNAPELERTAMLANELRELRKRAFPDKNQLMELGRQLVDQYHQFKIRNLASPDGWENRWDAHIGPTHGTKSAAQLADRERPRVDGQPRSYFFGQDRAFKAVDATLRAFIARNPEVHHHWSTSAISGGAEERLILDFNPQMAAIGRQTRGMDTTCSNLRVVFALKKDGLGLVTAYPYLPDGQPAAF